MGRKKRVSYAAGEREPGSPVEEADRIYVRFGGKSFEVFCDFLPTGNPCEGGYVVYENDNDELQIFAWEPNQPDDEYPRSYTTWFVVMAEAGEVLSDLDWVDWDHVRSFVGWKMDEVENLNRTEAPCSRAELYEAVSSYWGWGEMDHYPIVRSAEDMANILGGDDEDSVSARSDWLEEEEE